MWINKCNSRIKEACYLSGIIPIWASDESNIVFVFNVHASAILRTEGTLGEDVQYRDSHR